MNILSQRNFWLNLGGACLVAIVAAAPILMSGVMDRGFEIAKQWVAEPFAVLALGALVLAGGFSRLLLQGAAIRIAAGALLLFLLLAAISTALSENPEVAIFGGYYRREGLLAWGVYGAFFFAMLAWARNSNRITGFLDVLLLASVVPAIYAIQQRLGLDFYALGEREFARPGATLGSPLFLAAYFGLLLPVTLVRCGLARRQPSALALWLTVAALQACGLLLTQTRGPLLAVFTGLLLLACLFAAYARDRRFFGGTAIALAVVVAALVAINTIPGARQWAQEVPVASRLVFSLDRDALAATQRASNSAAARLAIWGAGVDTFAAAPPGKKLLGYGPESAYMHYFSHMPASVIRIQGYGVYHTYDRLHADALDIGLNFGLLAWLVYCLFFGAVVYAAVRALFGLSGRAPRWIFAGFACAGGVLAAVAAIEAGLGTAAVPAIGLGVGAGWILFAAGCAWRELKRGSPPAVPVEQTERWMLLAGLTAALCVFWIDAQVNIPVLTTRLISFGFAALILVIAHDLRSAAKKIAGPAPAPEGWLLGCGTACALVAACAGFLPVVLFDSTGAREQVHGWLRILPILSFLPVAGLAAWVHARRGGGFSIRLARVWLATAVGLPLIYVLVHYLLMVMPGAELSMHHVQDITMALFAGPVFVAAICAVHAVLATRSTAEGTDVQWLPFATRFWIFGLAAAVLLVAGLDWRATRADVASSLALRASVQQPQLSEQLIEEAVRLLPYERYYRRQLVFDLLGRALADIRRLGQEPDRIPDALRNLSGAESAARRAALLFPLDPWVNGALANVRQVQALRMLRSLDPAGGLLAAQEANRLFAYTHLMFPTEPLLLRNWAQLLFDQGNTPDAYKLLDLMEKLIPNDPEPYAERIAMAMQLNDNYTINETIARARKALDPQLFDRLPGVAKQQQN